MDIGILNYLLNQTGITINLVIIFLYLLISTLLIAIRQKLLLNAVGLTIKVIDSYKIIIFATIGSYLTPFTTGSFFFKVILLPYYTGATKKKSLFISSYEQAFEIIWIASLSLIAVFILPQWIQSKDIDFIIAISVIIIASTIIMGLFFDQIGMKLLNVITTLIPNNIKNLFYNRGLTKEKILIVLQRIKEITRNPKLLFGMIWPTLFSIFVVGLIVIFTARIFKVNLTLVHALIIYLIPNILGKLSGIPGGIGSQDISMGALLVNYGVDIETAAEITATFRIITTSYIFVAGGAIALIEGRKFIEMFRNKKKAVDL